MKQFKVIVYRTVTESISLVVEAEDEKAIKEQKGKVIHCADDLDGWEWDGESSDVSVFDEVEDEEPDLKV